jgi:hypothetical protein
MMINILWEHIGFAKENPSIKVLTMDQAMKVIKFPNLLTHFESNFSKELIERKMVHGE